MRILKIEYIAVLRMTMTRPVANIQQCVRAWTVPTHKVLLEDDSEKISVRISDLSTSIQNVRTEEMP